MRTPCVESMRTPSQKYPTLYFEGKVVNESRYMWIINNGEIPPGLQVCHHCDNRRCVRLDHLFLGTIKDNLQDMVSKGRHANQLKTHCPQGHEYTPENTYHPGRNPNERWCKICKEAARRAWRAKRRAAGRPVV